MTQPTVTFIMAARNAAATIRAAIESALAQDYDGQVSLIVVDDASTDTTARIVTEYPGVKLVRNQQRLGRSRSRNRALAHVATDLVAIQDADDISMPHRLSETVSLLSEGRLIIVGGQVQWSDPASGVFKGGFWPAEEREAQALLDNGRMPLAHPTMLIPLELIQAVGGYDGTFPVGEDLELLIRINRMFPDVSFVNSSSQVAIYARRRTDRFRYLIRAAYWRKRILTKHYLAPAENNRFAWFLEAVEGYFRQRLRLALKSIKGAKTR